MRSKRLLTSFLLAGSLMCLPAAAADRTSEAKPRMNVLFIAIDDLRPELGCYGRKHIHSPNIDRLAAGGVRFDRAVCQAPVCGPSRASLLSGIHPDPRTANLWEIDKFAPNVVTLPQTFRRAGYHTIANSKIFHGPKQAAKRSWSEPPTGHERHLEMFDPASKKFINPLRGRGPFFESPDVSEETYLDGQTCEKSLKDMRRLAKLDQPFFLAVGFVRPHLPFYAPKKYWDMYDRQEIALAENRGPIKNKPAQLHPSGEYRSYHDRGVVYNSDEFHRISRHGYYACVSYVDALVGRLLDELDRLKLSDNTIVVLWGDHGWLLGEHDFWAKANLLHDSLHLPLIFRVPGVEGNKATAGLVGLVDIYPTLLELTGIEKPDHRTGVSLVPLLENPESPWKKAAFSWWRNGRTVHTDRYTYTEWIKEGQVVGRMLFDRVNDPRENVNVAGLPENKPIVAKLHRLLEEGSRSQP